MPVVGVRELKAHASAILRKVRDEGEEYVVTFHGRPVGVLVPVDGDIVAAGTVSAARVVAQAQVSDDIIEAVAEQKARRRVRAPAAPPQATPAPAQPKEEAPRAAPKPAPAAKPARPRRPASAGRRRPQAKK